MTSPGGAVYGMTVGQFMSSLTENEVRRFVNPQILSVLDDFFGSRIPLDKLQSVAESLCNMSELLAERDNRKLVLDLLPEVKRTELEDRLEASLDEARSWTNSQVAEARRFFGVADDWLPAPPPLAVATAESGYGLFEYQRTALQRLEPLLWQNLQRVVLHLPTGAGKTRTAMHVVADSLRRQDPSVVVWLASGRELLEQAVASFQEAWKHLGNREVQLGSMWGSRTPDLDSFDDGFLAVGLAKGWVTQTSSKPDWALKLSQRTRLVVFDEAHQCIAPTYRQITEDLTFNYQCALLGLTATPGRTWDDIDEDGKLADFFGRNKVGLEVPGENPIEYLIESGYLARPQFETLFAEPGISFEESNAIAALDSFEVSDDVLELISLRGQYVSAVVDAIRKLLEDGHHRVLVFAASVAQARGLAAILAVMGSKSAVVTGGTGAQERKRTIASFKGTGREPMVLFNYGVLTTGFDAPQASAVVIARPTKSLVLYSQMVGRAIRGPKAGGTKTCKVVTVIDPDLPGFGDVAEAFHNWEDVWN